MLRKGKRKGRVKEGRHKKKQEYMVH